MTPPDNTADNPYDCVLPPPHVNHLCQPRDTADNLKGQGLREQIIKALGYKPEITYDDLTEIGIRDVARIESLIKTHQKALLDKVLEEKKAFVGHMYSKSGKVVLQSASTHYAVPVKAIKQLINELEG